MIICINCSTEIKGKMDNLITERNYKDYSELVAVAVENLWTLELEVGEGGALIIAGGPPLTSTSTTSPPPAKASPISASKWTMAAARQKNSTNAPSHTEAPAPVHIPALFLSEGLDEFSIPTTNLPPTENTESIFTLDRWLFGQYNKLLPLKANCRALLHLTAGQEKGTPLDSAAAQIAEAAALLGKYLADHDRRHKIGRDDSLATAFPGSSLNAEKSSARYVNQFLGSINSQGILSGLLQDYRLIGLAPEEGPRLLLTEPAVQFARLPNPILDGRQSEPKQKFLPEEVAFLLEHIQSRIPVESFAFRTLIRAIFDGADTPEKLNDALRFLVPTDSSRSLSTAFLTSQRSGALSRMADLGLIGRVRNGVRVSYAVTKQGQQFIEFNQPFDRGEKQS